MFIFNFYKLTNKTYFHVICFFIMTIKYYLADAFTDQQFLGNPAGICMMEGPAQEQWMQALAGEINQPATAFLYPYKDGFYARWFSPKKEIMLCGHATIATTHILYEQGIVQEGSIIKYYYKNGLLEAKQDGLLLEV